MKTYAELVNYLTRMNIVTDTIGAVVHPQEFFEKWSAAGIDFTVVPDEIWDVLGNPNYWDETGLTWEGVRNTVDKYDDYELFIAIVIMLSTYSGSMYSYEEHYLDLKLQGASREWLAGYAAGGGFKNYHNPHPAFGNWLSDMYRVFDWTEDSGSIY